MVRRLALWALPLLAGCGGASVDAEAPIQETNLAEASPPPESSTGNGAGETAPASAPDPTLPPGAILRQDLRNVLSAGPAAVLAMVETEPAREGKRFIGFKIVSFVRGEPKAVDLRPGDILVAVNGMKIIQPDDYFRVFQELAVASELRFDILREGQPKTLSYPIVE